jgi:hypothetical protein
MFSDGRWVYARDLQLGDVVISRENFGMLIRGLKTSSKKILVYNFLVDDLHNYVVGENGILVHNTNSPKNFDDIPDNISNNARRTPKNDAEAAALERIKNDPSLGKPLKIVLNDTHFLTGIWKKMVYKEGNIVIHYVYEIFERVAKDFKFKNP